MDLNITLVLILAVLIMVFITIRLINKMIYKIKRSLFSFGTLKIMSLFGGVSFADFHLVKQALNHFI